MADKKDKEKQLLYPVGVESLFIVFMDGKDDDREELPKYEDEIYRMDNIVTIGIAGDPQEVKKWASNKLFVSASRNSRFELDLTHVALPQVVQDKMDGVEHENGVSFSTSEVKEFPKFAFGFIAPLSDGSKVARWYPSVQKKEQEEEFETIEEEAEVKDQEANYEASPLLKNEVTEVKFSEARKDVDITAEDFMKQVITDKSQVKNIGKDSGDDNSDDGEGEDE